MWPGNPLLQAGRAGNMTIQIFSMTYATGYRKGNLTSSQLHYTGQKTTVSPVVPVSMVTKKKPSEDYEKLVAEAVPKTLSFIVTDLRTRRLAELNRETLWELLRTAGITGWYYCRRRFATRNVLLASEELAVKLVGSNISTKYFRLQPQHWGKRRLRVTMCNVPIQLAAYFIKYGSVEEVIPVRVTKGTVYGDYVLNICLDREDFRTIPHIIAYEDQQMMVAVEGRSPLCRSCKQLGYMARGCLQKAAASNNTTTISSNNNSSNNKNQEKTGNALEPGNHPNNPDEVWAQVTRKEKTNNRKITTTDSTTKSAPPVAAAVKIPTSVTNIGKTTTVTTTEKSMDKPATETTTTTIQPASSPSKKPRKKTKKKISEGEQPEEMDITINLKRRRDSGKTKAEKFCTQPNPTAEKEKEVHTSLKATSQQF